MLSFATLVSVMGRRNVAHGSIDKLEVYRGLGIREVLPEIDLARLAHVVLQPDQHEALKAYRNELRYRAPNHG